MKKLPGSEHIKEFPEFPDSTEMGITTYGRKKIWPSGTSCLLIALRHRLKAEQLGYEVLYTGSVYAYLRPKQ